MCSPDALCASAGEVLEALGAGDHVDDARLLDRLAGVAGLERGELVVALAQDLRGLTQDACALGAGERRPLRLRLARGQHRRLHFRRTGNRHVAEAFTSRGIEGNEAISGRFCEII